jgi:hypothetical protein
MKDARIAFLLCVFWITCGLQGCASYSSNGNAAKAAVATLSAVNPVELCPGAQSGQTLQVMQTLQTWIICKYTRTVAVDSQVYPYFSLAITVSQGDSPVNSVGDVGFWKRVGGLLHQKVTSAVVTLKIDDGVNSNPPEIPVFALTRASDGTSSPKTSSPAATALPQQMPVMPYTSAARTQQWAVTLGYKYSNEVNDHVASTAIQVAKQLLKANPVTGTVASLVPQIDQNDRKKLDSYVGQLFSYTQDPPPVAFSMSANDYAQVESIVAVVYDDVLTAPSKKVVAYIKLSPRFAPSLYASLDAQGQLHYPGIGEYGQFIPELGGSTRDLFNKYHPDLTSLLSQGNEAIFSQVCHSGPQDFASYHLEPDSDAVYATWLVLMSSPAADSKRSNGEMCSSVVLDSMASLHLRQFPFQVVDGDSLPAQRARNVAISNAKTAEVSSAVAQQNSDLTQYFAEKVTVVQHADVIDGIDLNTSVAVDGETLAGAIKAKGQGRLYKFSHTGLASPVVKATLSVASKSYPVTIRWSGLSDSDKIISMDIGSPK